MSKKTILVLDTEDSVKNLVKVALERYHFNVLPVASANEMFECIKETHIDLVIMEVLLPNTHGFEICKQLRETLNIPVIMLTSLQGEMNTVLGFEAGADDYIEKPFSVYVLIARIKAVLKRCSSQTDALISTLKNIPQPKYSRAIIGHWTYTPKEALLTYVSGSGVSIQLSRNESYLLQLFLATPEKVLSREIISEALGFDMDDIESRAIDVLVSRLRQKFKDKNQVNIIKSIRNKGYLITASVKLF
ncbi:MAG: hypothetical protein COB50_00055 [Thiotrichales bacterium]|nr:MAG: hypothetical protein COB50_00055 [Thiotrichales bacterium]